MIADFTIDEPEQSDSGMESLTASKDDTPERKPDDNFLSPAPVRNLPLSYFKVAFSTIIKCLILFAVRPHIVYQRSFCKRI